MNQHLAPTTIHKPLGRRTFAGAGLAVVLLLGACGSDSTRETVAVGQQPPTSLPDTPVADTVQDDNESSENESSEPEAQERTGDALNLNHLGGDWSLHSITFEGAPVATDDWTIPTISFAGPNFTMFAGCDTFAGSVADGDPDTFAMQLDPLAELGPPCSTGLETQGFVLQSLSRINRFTVEAGELILTDDTESPTELRFFALTPMHPPQAELEDLEG